MDFSIEEEIVPTKRAKNNSTIIQEFCGCGCGDKITTLPANLDKCSTCEQKLSPWCGYWYYVEKTKLCLACFLATGGESVASECSTSDQNIIIDLNCKPLYGTVIQSIRTLTSGAVFFCCNNRAERAADSTSECQHALPKDSCDNDCNGVDSGFVRAADSTSECQQALSKDICDNDCYNDICKVCVAKFFPKLLVLNFFNQSNDCGSTATPSVIKKKSFIYCRRLLTEHISDELLKSLIKTCRDEYAKCLSDALVFIRRYLQALSPRMEDEVEEYGFLLESLRIFPLSAKRLKELYMEIRLVLKERILNYTTSQQKTLTLCRFDVFWFNYPTRIMMHYFADMMQTKFAYKTFFITFELVDAFLNGSIQDDDIPRDVKIKFHYCFLEDLTNKHFVLVLIYRLFPDVPTVIFISSHPSESTSALNDKFYNKLLIFAKVVEAERHDHVHINNQTQTQDEAPIGDHVHINSNQTQDEAPSGYVALSYLQGALNYLDGVLKTSAESIISDDFLSLYKQDLDEITKKPISLKFFKQHYSELDSLKSAATTLRIDDELNNYFLSDEGDCSNMITKSLDKLIEFEAGQVVGDEFIINRITSSEYLMFKEMSRVDFSVDDIRLTFIPVILNQLVDMYNDRANVQNIDIHWQNIELFMKLIRAKLQVTIVNELLTSDAAETFFRDKPDQRTKLKLKVKTKHGVETMLVKGIRDKITKAFKVLFVCDIKTKCDFEFGDYRKRWTNCQQFSFIAFAVNAILENTDIFQELDRNDFKSFCEQQGVSVAVVNSGDAFSQECSQSTDSVTKDIRNKKSTEGSDLQCSDLDLSSVDVEAVTAPLLLNNTSDSFFATTGMSTIRVIRLYFADPTSEYVKSITSFAQESSEVTWEMLTEAEPDLLSDDYSDTQKARLLNGFSNLISKKVKQFQAVSLSKVAVKTGYHCQHKKKQEFKRRHTTVNPHTVFYEVLCRLLVIPDQNNKKDNRKLIRTFGSNLEKIFHAELKYNGVTKPLSSLVDSSKGEFVHLFHVSTLLRVESNQVIMMNILDHLENITSDWYNKACSLDSFKITSLSQIQPSDLPKDCLFLVDKEMPLLRESVDMTEVYSLFDGFIYSDDPYPNLECIHSLASSIQQHVEKLPILRRTPEIRILILGCEQPVFVVVLYLLLTSKDYLQNRVKKVQICIIEKNLDRCQRGVDILTTFNASQAYQIPMDDLNFKNENFLVYPNSMVSAFDIILNLVSSASQLFAIKFCMLLFESNTRPYYQFSKLFLIRKGFLRVLNPDALGVKKRALSITSHFFCEMKHSQMIFDNRTRNILKVKSFSPQSSSSLSFLFQYFSEVDSTFTIKQDRYLSELFFQVLQRQIEKCHQRCVNALYNQSTSRFFDVILNPEGVIYMLLNSRMHSSMVLNLGECCLTISISDIDGIRLTPDLTQFTALSDDGHKRKEIIKATKNTFTLQSGQILEINQTTMDALTDYLEINVSNVLNCLSSIHAHCSHFASLVLSAVNHEQKDTPASDFKYFLEWFIQYSTENCPTSLRSALDKYTTSAKNLKIFSLPENININWNAAAAAVSEDRSFRQPRRNKNNIASVTSNNVEHNPAITNVTIGFENREDILFTGELSSQIDNVFGTLREMDFD